MEILTIENIGVVLSIIIASFASVQTYIQFKKNKELELSKMILENLDWLRQDIFNIKNLFDQYFNQGFDKELPTKHSVQNIVWGKIVYLSNYIIKTNSLIKSSKLSKKYQTDLSNIVVIFYFHYLNILYLQFKSNMKSHNNYNNHDFIKIYLKNHEEILKELYKFNTSDFELMEKNYREYLDLHLKKALDFIMNSYPAVGESYTSSPNKPDKIETTADRPFKEDNIKLYSSFLHHAEDDNILDINDLFPILLTILFSILFSIILLVGYSILIISLK